MPFDPLEEFLRVVALPGGIAGGAALLGRVAFAGKPRVRDALLALGVGLGTLAGLWALGHRPSFPLAAREDGWLWAVWVAPAAALLGIAGALLAVPEGVRIPVRVAAGVGAAWLVLMPMVGTEWGQVPAKEALLRAGVAGLLSGGIATGIAWRARKPAGFSTAIPLLVTLAATGYCVADRAGFLYIGEAAGILASCVGAVALLSRPRTGPALPRAVAPGIALFLVALLVGAHAYLNPGSIVRFPASSGLLLAGAAMTAPIRPWWLATAISAGLAAGAILLAGGETDTNAYTY